MSQNIYFDEDKKLNVSAVLKDLPKVNAPDNFEYNLMVRVQNRNFDEEKYKETSWRWTWFLAPGAAFVFSVLLLLNVFSAENGISEKLITDNANLIQESSAAKQFIWAMKNENDRKEAAEVSGEPEAYQVVLNSNDVVATKKIDPSILKGRGYDLDIILDKAKSSKFSRGRGTLVSAGVPSFNFDGFFIRVEEDSTKSGAQNKEK